MWQKKYRANCCHCPTIYNNLLKKTSPQVHVSPSGPCAPQASSNTFFVEQPDTLDYTKTFKLNPYCFLYLPVLKVSGDPIW